MLTAIPAYHAILPTRLLPATSVKAQPPGLRFGVNAFNEEQDDPDNVEFNPHLDPRDMKTFILLMQKTGENGITPGEEEELIDEDEGWGPILEQAKLQYPALFYTRQNTANVKAAKALINKIMNAHTQANLAVTLASAQQTRRDAERARARATKQEYVARGQNFVAPVTGAVNGTIAGAQTLFADLGNAGLRMVRTSALVVLTGVGVLKYGVPMVKDALSTAWEHMWGKPAVTSTVNFATPTPTPQTAKPNATQAPNGQRQGSTSNVFAE